MRRPAIEAPLVDRPPPYATVAFDCDSTLSAIEGIDELARLAGADTRALTEAAMRGEVALEDVYARRLELVRPTRALVEAVGALYVERAVPGARAALDALRALGKRVVVVSGGLAPAVRRLGAHLGFAERDVHAVGIDFAADGSYLGFERASPLARAGGKIDVLRALRAGTEGGALALVGDGTTDLETALAPGAADRFVAFGGVARREAVFARALAAVEALDLAAVLPHLLTDAERERLGLRSGLPPRTRP